MSKIRFGLVGYGAWGRHHAQAIAQTSGALLVAVAARSAESAQAAQAAHPAARVYHDYRSMLERETLDVVDVVTPPHLHHSVAMAALAAGRHLLVEKPLALTVAHCDEIAALAKKTARTVAVGFELRLSSLWGMVKQLIDAGSVGTPLYVLIELWRRPYRPGSDGWRYDIARVGNWVLEEPIHFFDLACWYLSTLGAPVSVYARANSRQAGHPELQDNFSAMLQFPGGAYAVISQTLAAYEHHQTVKISGTNGALWAAWSGAQDRTRHATFSLRHFDGSQVRELPMARPSGELFELEEEIAMLVRAVRDGTPVAATAEDGRRSVALCLAAQQSVNSGEVVKLESIQS